MKSRKNTWLPWALCAIVVVCVVFALVLSLNDPSTRSDPFAILITILDSSLGIAFGVVGAMILSRLGRNRIGGLLMTIAVSTSLMGPLQSYFEYKSNLMAEPSAMTYLLSWLSGWTWWLLIGPLLLILLLFPTGKLLSRRWRWVVALISLVFATFMVVGTLTPEWPNPVTGINLPNPLIQSQGFLTISFETIQLPWTIALLAAVALCVLSVFIRYRRSGVTERLQLKWFLYACAIFIAIYVADGLVFLGVDPPDWMSALLSLAILILPISIGIAILRYRLFEINILIRRTLQYALLTSILAMIYYGGVIIIEAGVSALTGREYSPVVVVLTTLIIAALFNPLRVRTQEFIERRFFRTKYDAEKALAEFSSIARDEVEINLVEDALLNVVDETMHPEHISLWIR